MNRLTTNITLLLAAFALVVGAYFALNQPAETHASAIANVISAATTTTSFSVTTSARVLATTTNTVGTGYTRVYASICNPNSNPVALLLNGDKPANLATGKMTTVIAAAAGYNACYEITDRNAYSGSITASSTNETATTVYVADYVQ